MRVVFSSVLILITGFHVKLARGNQRDSVIVKSSIERFVSLGDTLEGILEVPLNAGKRPLVVFVHGSGRVDRSDYYYYVEKFWKEGYATFRYDKRGVGKSGGQFLPINQASSAASLPKLAQDAHSAVLHLSKNKFIDAQNIMLMGNSQAGWIIPVAANLGGVSKIIIVSGPAVTVGEEMYYSKLVEFTNENYSNDQIDELLSNYSDERGFDPVPYMIELKIPAIWFIGGMDRSIPSARTIKIIQQIGKEYKKDFEVKEYPYGDHGLRNTITGQWEELFQDLIPWIKKHER